MRLSFAHNTLSSQARYSAFRFLLAYFGRWSAIAVAVYKTGRVTVQFECGDRMTVPADKALTCIRFISPPDTGAPMQLTLPRGNVKVEIRKTQKAWLFSPQTRSTSTRFSKKNQRQKELRHATKVLPPAKSYTPYFCTEHSHNQRSHGRCTSEPRSITRLQRRTLRSPSCPYSD